MQHVIAELFGCTLLVLTILLSNGEPVAIGLAYALLTGILAPISGAHLNPAVTIMNVVRGSLSAIDGVFYVLAQIAGALAGFAAASAL